MKVKTVVLLAASILLAACTSQTNTSPVKEETRTPPSAEGRGAARPGGLAAINDRDAFAEQFKLVKNPHLVATANYLSGGIEAFASNQSAAPGTDDQMRIQAYPLMSALWPNPNITACWENPDDSFAVQMASVKAAIASTWEAASKLRFTGWTKCPPASTLGQRVIRIQIDDSSAQNGPRTLGLGKQVDAVQHGMLLNFTFLHWGINCQTMEDYCIKAIAVHEFGHAIGFAHEQNRPDKPGECMDAPQGTNGNNTLLTPYDPDSVMNYCNRKYNNDGNLSALDQNAVTTLYGAP